MSVARCDRNVPGPRLFVFLMQADSNASPPASATLFSPPLPGAAAIIGNAPADLSGASAVASAGTVFAAAAVASAAVASAAGPQAPAFTGASSAVDPQRGDKVDIDDEDHPTANESLLNSEMMKQREIRWGGQMAKSPNEKGFRYFSSRLQSFLTECNTDSDFKAKVCVLLSLQPRPHSRLLTLQVDCVHVCVFRCRLEPFSPGSTRRQPSIREPSPPTIQFTQR